MNFKNQSLLKLTVNSFTVLQHIKNFFSNVFYKKSKSVIKHSSKFFINLKHLSYLNETFNDNSQYK